MNRHGFQILETSTNSTVTGNPARTPGAWGDRENADERELAVARWMEKTEALGEMINTALESS